MAASTAETQAPRFENILERICAGSDEAVWEFIEQYGPHIQRVIRRRLNQRLRSQFDSTDFVQMVWATFFAHPDAIRRFHQPDQLLRYLVAVARNKVIDESRRRLKLQRYNVGREQFLDQSDCPASPQASPSQIAMARERWQQMMNQNTERNRRIVQLRIAGATYDEIGQQLGIHERTARQVIAELANA